MQNPVLISLACNRPIIIYDDWLMREFLVVSVTNCDMVIYSDNSKNGTISSPGYPEPYPAHSYCRLDFQGRGKERVQIIFRDFDLFNPNDDAKE